ncbi:MAG: hypothetical protein NVS9B2_00940 [Steroidobacteraceae bacterium]
MSHAAIVKMAAAAVIHVRVFTGALPSVHCRKKLPLVHCKPNFHAVVKPAQAGPQAANHRIAPPAAVIGDPV